MTLAPWSDPPQWMPRPEGPRQRQFAAYYGFKHHMSDEGWQLQQGMESAGYELFGRGYPNSQTDLSTVRSDILIVQDRREWHHESTCCYDPSCEFQNLASLHGRNDILKLVIWKDAWKNLEWHREGHQQLNPHYYLHYYDTAVLCSLNPWLPPDRLIRIYHTVDANSVPTEWPSSRRHTIVSGAKSLWAYPLRNQLIKWAESRRFHGVDVLRHPGYGAFGVHTDQYLRTLMQYRVSICTASKFGCLLRKMIESTACGCIVVTDLPEHERFPGIDENLIRIPPDISPPQLQKILDDAVAHWDEDRQRHYAKLALARYDYRIEGQRIAAEIDKKYKGE